MFMYYLTIKDDENSKEKLVAVAGEENLANYLLNNIDGAIETHTRSLNQLFDNNVEIPMSMKWIVESDSKHQKREADDRVKNLCGLSFPPKS